MSPSFFFEIISPLPVTIQARACGLLILLPAPPLSAICFISFIYVYNHKIPSDPYSRFTKPEQFIHLFTPRRVGTGWGGRGWIWQGRFTHLFSFSFILWKVQGSFPFRNFLLWMSPLPLFKKKKKKLKKMMLWCTSMVCLCWGTEIYVLCLKKQELPMPEMWYFIVSGIRRDRAPHSLQEEKKKRKKKNSLMPEEAEGEREGCGAWLSIPPLPRGLE